MYLEELNLVNFRNLKNQKLHFKKGVIVFWGDNAQGKTNLLETIYLLSSAKSFRTRVDHELVVWGANQAKVSGKVDHLDIELTVKEQSKSLVINKQPKKLTEIIGSFITVLFTPSDVALVSGPPSERRVFLDRLCSNLSKEYLYQLVAFNKVLRNRNHVLFKLNQGGNDDLTVWDNQLAKHGAFIWNYRQEVIDKLNSKLKVLSNKLLQASLILDYQNPHILETQPKTAQNYVVTLETTAREDILKKQTGVGPHRDNFKFIMDEQKGEKIVSKDLGIYGSRGEQRAASLSLKFAEVELLEEERGVKPVLLLDEVLSELDQKHRELLLRQVSGGQTFITSTSVDAVESVLGQKVISFEIKNGEVLS